MNISVIGGYKCSKKSYAAAQKLGRLIAQQGWILICGGGSGVMEAAAKGAKSAAGTTVGILPSYDTGTANDYLDIKIPTGLGYARNILVVRAGAAVVAVDGAYGTLSEIAFALNEKIPVYGIDTWGIDGIIKAKSPQDAVEKIKKRLANKGVRVNK